MANFNDYIYALKNSPLTYVSVVELLDETETISKPILIDMYNSSSSLRISLQNGARRSFSLTLDNSNKQYDIDVNKLWIYQKAKLFVGYQFVNKLGNADMFLIPQGVFYITNPDRTYNPTNKTITFECVDKWARLNGILGGKLEGNFSFPKYYKDEEGVEHYYEYDMFDIIRNLLKTPLRSDYRNIAFIDKEIIYANATNQINTFLTQNNFTLVEIKNKESIVDSKGNIYYCNNTPKVNPPVYPVWEKAVKDERVVDNLEPILDNKYYSNDILGNLLVYAPYSISKGINNTYEDIILEISSILSANCYYDRVGRFTLQSNSESNFLKDIDKEVVWEFYENNNDGILYDLPNEKYDFTNVYNQIVLRGTITDVGSYVVCVANEDVKSNTCVQKIGVKSFSTDDNYVYNPKLFTDKLKLDNPTKTDEEIYQLAIEECKKALREVAKQLLKKYTIMQSKLTIKCLSLPHLDVDQVVTITKQDNTNSISKKYLINSIDLPLSPTEPMTLECNSIFDIDITVIR